MPKVKDGSLEKIMLHDPIHATGRPVFVCFLVDAILQIGSLKKKSDDFLLRLA